MPLTNPNKVVTEERLSEFYGQILPYMGGMPDVLANKFSRSDIYSTTEKMVGQWTDGKPLYQKTISLTVPGSSGSVSTGISNGSNARIVSGYLETSGGNSWNALDGTLVVSLDASTITNGRNSDYSGRPAYATLQYTKTTDSAISIGVDTDYSTTEKIVGTWVDGKPIWQKTVAFTTGSSSDTNINHNISNIDKVINSAGFIIDGDNYKPFGFYSTSSAYISLFVSTTQLKIRAGGSDQYNKSAYATIQYTKTS